MKLIKNVCPHLIMFAAVLPDIHATKMKSKQLDLQHEHIKDIQKKAFVFTDQYFSCLIQLSQQLICILIGYLFTRYLQAQLPFNFQNDFIDTLECESSSHRTKVSVIATSDGHSQTLSHTQCCVNNYKWISIAVSTWPKTDHDQFVVLPGIQFFIKSLRKLCNNFWYGCVKNILKIPAQAYGLIIWSWLLPIDETRFSKLLQEQV